MNGPGEKDFGRLVGGTGRASVGCGTKGTKSVHDGGAGGPPRPRPAAGCDDGREAGDPPPALGRRPSPLADHTSDRLAGARVAGGAVAAESSSTVAGAALQRNFWLMLRWFGR